MDTEIPSFNKLLRFLHKIYSNNSFTYQLRIFHPFDDKKFIQRVRRFGNPKNLGTKEVATKHQMQLANVPGDINLILITLQMIAN